MKRLGIGREPFFGLLVLFGLHCLFVFAFFPLQGITNNLPYAQKDYGFHFYDAYAFRNVLGLTGHTWGYDPFFLAGYPIGVLDNLDNRILEWGVASLQWLGDARAFDVVVLALNLAFPFIIYWCGRLWGLKAWTCFVATLFGLVLWHFESFTQNMWQTGAISFLAAAYWAPVELALLQKYIEKKSVGMWFVLLLVTLFLSVLHTFALFIIAVPVIGIYILSWRALGWKQHLALWLVLLFVFVVNLYWLVPSLHFAGLVNHGSLQLQGGVDALLDDVRGFVGRAALESSASSGLRWSVTLLGLVGALYWWRKTHSRDSFVFGGTIVALLFLAYFGTYLSEISALEPFRYVVPAALFACFPAAFLLTSLNWQAFFKNRTRVGRLRVAGLVLGTIFAVASLGQAVVLSSPWSALSNLTSPDAFEQVLLNPCQSRLMRWIRQNTTTDARILIQDNRTGALIPYFTQRQVIGGPFFQRQFQQNFANASFKSVFGVLIPDFRDAVMQDYLRTFNIEWIISDDGAARGGSITNYVRSKNPPFLQLVALPCNFRVYQANLEPTLFLQGGGSVAAQYDGLQVANASAGTVVLKYHWLDTLRTDPPLPLSPYPVPHDPVPFIQIENGDVQNFSVYNSYSDLP